MMIGIDLGGTNLRTAVIERDAFLHDQRKEPVGEPRDPETIVARCAKLVEGTSNCAGEIGHTTVRWDDQAEPCACGSRGCIEAYCGGSYIQRRIVRELSGNKKSKALELAGSIENVNAGHVDEAAAAGDDWALALWSELAPLLAVTLGNAVAVLNPERLVLGGGLLGRCPTLYAMVEATMMIAGNAPSLEPLVIVEAELGDDAGIVGAAHLANRGVSIVS